MNVDELCLWKHLKEQVDTLIAETTAFYGDRDAVQSMLQAVTQTYSPKG